MENLSMAGRIPESGCKVRSLHSFAPLKKSPERTYDNAR